MEPDVPPQVARDGVQHSFAAYYDALRSMWDGNRLAEMLRDPPCPVTVVLPEDDQTVLPADLLDLPPSPDVRIVRAPGDHGVAYDQPDLITDVLLEHPPATAGTAEGEAT